MANPAAGRDIRRLVGHAATIDNHGKLSILRRLLVGLSALGTRRVLFMPDAEHLAERALQGLRESTGAETAVEVLDLPVLNTPADSTAAAHRMREAGAGSIIVLGGDGTVRVTARGAGDVPLVAISTGTNNVVPAHVEGTIAGMAAAAIARGLVTREQAALRHKRLILRVDGRPRSDALVDVAALVGRFVGARAIWDVNAIRQIVVTRASPAGLGVSALVGATRPLAPDEPAGVSLTLSPGAPRRRIAALAPGLIVSFGVAQMREIALGEEVDLVSERPLLLAFDGEREVRLGLEERATLELRADGPWIVDCIRVMEALAAGNHMAPPGLDNIE